MTRTNIFGIVGGYGATGSAVVTALLKSGVGEILIGGRDLSKAIGRLRTYRVNTSLVGGR